MATLATEWKASTLKAIPGFAIRYLTIFEFQHFNYTSANTYLIDALHQRETVFDVVNVMSPGIEPPPL